MSNSLVRESLELFGYDQQDNLKERKKNKRRKSKAGTLDLIPRKHSLISRNKKNPSNSTLPRTSKLTVYEVKKKLQSKKDSTEDNIQRLLLLSSQRIDSETADKLLNRALNKRSKPKEEKPKEPESTIFTEEDFQKFEAEYIG